jgi:hypothetical protein
LPSPEIAVNKDDFDDQGGWMSVDEQTSVHDGDDLVEGPKVFISYSHDSAEHKEMVHRFASFLHEEVGVEVKLDKWSDDGRRDWSLWAIQALKHADFVLVIASPAYRQRADGDAPANEGRGAQFEAAMIRNELTRDLAGMTRRILPVVLPGMSIDDIPAFLNAYSTTRYVISEFTLDGVEELRVAFTGKPLYSPPPLGRFRPVTSVVKHPVVVTKAVPTVAEGGVLAPGAEVLIGSDRYLVHSAYFGEVPANDPSVVERQANALRLGENDYVWMRQLEIRAYSEISSAAVAALRSEHKIATTLRGNGIPRPLALVENGRLVTAITSWGSGKTTEPLAGFLPDPGEPLDPGRVSWLLKGMASLCRVLVRLHERRVAHRALTPQTILVAGNGQLVLRDLGLAAVRYRPGEAAGEYQAPEQRRRTSGQPGPWTDTYQVAALTYHLLAGRAPASQLRLPLGSATQHVPRSLCDAVDLALATDPKQRPEMTRLARVLAAPGPAL